MPEPTPLVESARSHARSPPDLVCRSCGAPLDRVMVDLGSSPLANSYLQAADLARAELFLPLCVYVCERCWLCQLPECATPQEIFSDYAYFSSFSTSWLEHARTYSTRWCRASARPQSQVIEIASNDGYLLRRLRRPRHPGARDRTGGERRRGGSEAGHPDRGAFLRRGRP